MSEHEAGRRAKTRSPAYPAINLETAIQRARQLYAKEKLHATPVLTVVRHWGYTSLNGAALGTIAAVKKYGLLDDAGGGDDRRATLSRLADDILSNPDPEKRKKAIQEAALRPALFGEMWDRHHLDLPSDQNLLWELTRDRGFTDRGAAEFIRSYKATIAFARLEEPRYLGEPAATPDTRRIEDEPHEDMHDARSEPVPPERVASAAPYPASEKAKSYSIPLIDSGVVVVEGQFPITERDWRQLMDVLAAMKPGLVTTISDEADTSVDRSGHSSIST